MGNKIGESILDTLKQLLDSAPCGMGLYPLDGERKSVYLNTTYFRIIGYTREEYAEFESDDSRLIFPEDLEIVKQLYGSFFRGKKEMTSEYRIINKEGAILWIKLALSHVTILGKMYAFVSFTDISYEKKLSEQFGIFAKNIESSISIIRVQGEQLTLEYGNDYFFRATGLSRESSREDMLKQLKRGVSGSVVEQIKSMVHNGIKTDRCSVMEYPYFTAEGKSVWLRRNFTVIPQTGDNTYLLLSVTTDVTEEHEAKEKLSQEQEQNQLLLKEQNELLLSTVSNIIAGIIVYQIKDGEFSIVDVNPAACRIMAIDPAKAIGLCGDSIFKLCCPEDTDIVRSAWEKLHIPGTEVHYEFRFLNRDKKKYLWMAADAKSVARPDGTKLVYINYRDITEEKRLMESEIEIEAQKRANKAKAEFFAQMSHDMRTPMNGILGLANLSRDETSAEVLRDNFAKVEESGRYLLGLINDTLDFQRIETGRMVLEPRIVNGREVMNSIIDLAQRAADEKGVHLKITSVNAQLDWYVIMDELRVKQMLINILSNAIKFTPKDGTVEFLFQCLSRDGMISHDLVIVRDTGIGMSEDFLKNRIFQPFAQEYSEVTGKYAGSGLGLSITKQLIELMGGKIEVESQLGVGSEFRLYFDLERVEQVAAEGILDKSRNQDAVSIRSLEGKKVLLVEDHPLNAEIGKRLLDKAGVQTDCLKNGAEAVARIGQADTDQYDAILMDIRMPVMDGLEATRQIRALGSEYAKTIPIIAMTANAYPEDVMKSRESGMNDHLSKPIIPEKLYEMLMHWVNK